MKKLARGKETVVLVPPVPDLVEIQVSLVIVPVEDGADEVAIRVPPDQTDNVLSAIWFTAL